MKVLLRTLEFFSGILILTTNRIRTLDFAVQSRINLALKFQDLEPDAKKQIYLNFIEQLNSDDADTVGLRAWINDTEEQDENNFALCNGRQIRNVVFTAAKVAGAEKMTAQHVVKILKETNSFNNDISKLMVCHLL